MAKISGKSIEDAGSGASGVVVANLNLVKQPSVPIAEIVPQEKNVPCI